MVRAFGIPVLFGAALALPALAGCGGGTTNNATPDMAMGGRCATPGTVRCQDESILQLSLKKAPSTRTITNAADGGGFLSEVDATGGAGTGIDPKESFVYAKFTDTGLVTVALGDEAALASTDWDIAFRRYVIRLNSGVSGPGCVDGARAPASTTYESLTAPPAGLEYRTEAYFTESCDYVPDGSGLMSPGTALQSFWMYPGCVQMTGNVFVIRLADGRSVKLVVTRYYEKAAQDDCDANGMLGPNDTGKGGHVEVRWAFLGA